MKILVVGGGGREHALCWRLAGSGHEVFVAPGNPGAAQVATQVDVGVDDYAGLAALASQRAVDLVVIGPEAPLVGGLADRMRQRGLTVFGPSASAARLEGSKAFSKQFFDRHGIRTAEFKVCSDMRAVDAALAELGGEVVVKADGLAGGKGVVVCDSTKQARASAAAMLESGRFGQAGLVVVIERRLRGRELSVMALADGTRSAMLPPVEDHKTIFDGDKGPNTGGMGTVSPAGGPTRRCSIRVQREILDPTVAGLRADGTDFPRRALRRPPVDESGAPWILEYNCRFGDPETQPVHGAARHRPGRVAGRRGARPAAGRGAAGDRARGGVRGPGRARLSGRGPHRRSDRGARPRAGDDVIVFPRRHRAARVQPGHRGRAGARGDRAGRQRGRGARPRLRRWTASRSRGCRSAATSARGEAGARLTRFSRSTWPARRKQPDVAILMGSKSDLDMMRPAADVLRSSACLT